MIITPIRISWNCLVLLASLHTYLLVTSRYENIFYRLLLIRYESEHRRYEKKEKVEGDDDVRKKQEHDKLINNDVLTLANKMKAM